MYTLLNICLVLHPMRIDESVHSQLQDKYQDKKLRMQKGSVIIPFHTSQRCAIFFSPWLLLIIFSYFCCVGYEVVVRFSCEDNTELQLSVLC